MRIQEAALQFRHIDKVLLRENYRILPNTCLLVLQPRDDVRGLQFAPTFEGPKRVNPALRGW